MRAPLQFVHRFEAAARTNARPLLLLHGTGGNEDDLVPLGHTVAPGAALLSPRGQVLEGGMPRFFRRFAEGVFDQEDVRRRANDLADFVAAACTQYGIATPIALGYSNGANVAAAVLLLRPEALAGAILFRATLPLDPAPQVDLAGMPVLITSGARDPIIREEGAARLAKVLASTGARVEHRTLPAGHELSPADLTLARQWFAEHGGLGE